MERREFLIKTAKYGSLLLLLPVGWSVASCNGNDNNGATANQGNSLVFTSSTVESHNHEFVIVPVDLTSPPAAGITGDTSITLGHLHTVSLTQAQLQQIEAGQTVTQSTSTTEGHMHSFAFSLGAAATTGAGGSGGSAGVNGAAGAGGTTGQAGATGQAGTTGQAGSTPTPTPTPVGGY